MFVSTIRKTVLSGGREHYIQIDSSLDLEEIEITGSDPISGKTVHVSLSSLLKQPSKPVVESESKPLDMFGESEMMSEEERPQTLETSARDDESGENNDNVLSDLFD